MARLESKPTNAFLKHLSRAQRSHCPEHKWASARKPPEQKPIFCREEAAEKKVSPEDGIPEIQARSRKMVPQIEPPEEPPRSHDSVYSKQIDALDLQGSGVCKTKTSLTESQEVPTADVGQNHPPESPEQVSDGPSHNHGSPEESPPEEGEGKARPTELPTLTQEKDADQSLVGPTQDITTRKCPSEAEVNLAAAGDPGKQRKKSKLGNHGVRPSSHFPWLNFLLLNPSGQWREMMETGAQLGDVFYHQVRDGWMDERPLDAAERASALRLGFRWYPYFSEADSKNISSRRERYTFERQPLKDLQTQKQSTTNTLAEGETPNETKSKGQKSNPRPPPQTNQQEEKSSDETSGSGPFYYIGGANGVDILNAYCKNKGWQRIYDNRREDYLLKWCETKFRDTYYNFREGEQLLYQIPNNKILTTKIGLLMNLREYERVMKKVNKSPKILKMEDFFPETFRLDTKDEREIFFEIYREPHIWICKPTSSNQGRGIFLLKNQAEVRELQARLLTIEEDPLYRKLPYKVPPARIVQRYIDRPLLLEGKKFDVRSYLLIACTVPYMLFFGHGYVRLTCLNYDPRSEDLTSHLTNQYVQKKSPMYSLVKEETVWQMDRFNSYVNEKFRFIKGLPKDWVFNGFTKRMKEIMLQSFLAVRSKLDCKLGYFDLIGCDFLIDEDFKVWLLEMNANPALHTNCNALKNIIPTVVNETLDLTIEIFSKCQKGRNILPLDSLCHFALLYNGMASESGFPRPTKSRTSLRSWRAFRLLTENSVSGSGPQTNSNSSSRVAEKPPFKASEKSPKMDPLGPPEGFSLPPTKAVPRSTLSVPQIQISIVPNAFAQGGTVGPSANQYIIKPVQASPERPPNPENHEEAEKGGAGVFSKDKSYSAWFQRTFGGSLPSAGGRSGQSGKGNPGSNLTSSQMVSLHLQSNLPPSLPVFSDFPKPLRQLMTHAKRPSDGEEKDGAAAAGETLPEDKKISHRGS